MNYKYEEGQTVILDGNKVAEIVAREAVMDVNLYTVRLKDAHSFWTLTINENRLSVALPGRLLKCECGADALLGPYNPFHSSWCQRYIKDGTV